MARTLRSFSTIAIKVNYRIQKDAKATPVIMHDDRMKPFHTRDNETYDTSWLRPIEQQESSDSSEESDSDSEPAPDNHVLSDTLETLGITGTGVILRLLAHAVRLVRLFLLLVLMLKFLESRAPTRMSTLILSLTLNRTLNLTLILILRSHFQNWTLKKLKLLSRSMILHVILGPSLVVSSFELRSRSTKTFDQN